VNKRTINCESGYPKVEGDKLVLTAFRGKEIITVKLVIGDYQLMETVRKCADLAGTRRKAYLEKSAYLCNNIKAAVERVAA
jgi:hypothetical protein